METVRSADGTTIAYDRLGFGPPVIVLAGATCTRGVTAPLAEALATRVTVLNADRRGRGDSDDRTVAPYAVEREVEDVAALVEAAGGSAAVYGHSSGAAVALRAAHAGVGVTRVVLHDAPFGLPGSEQAARDWHATLGTMLAEGRPGDAIAAFMAKVGVPPHVLEGMRKGPGWPAMEAVAPTLAYDSAAMGDADGGLVPADLLPGVPVPALVAVGGANPPFMRQAAEQLAEGLPDARLEVLADLGHDIVPDVVAPVVVPFVLG